MKKTPLLFAIVLAILTELSSSFGVLVTKKQRIRVWSHDQQGDEMVGASERSEGGMLATSWVDKVDKNFLKKIEEELVQRYKQQGLLDDEAQREATAFLGNKEQAEKYLEMRMYSEANASDVPGLVIQLVGGFLVGFSIIAGPKLLQAYQAASLDSFPTV
jgi:hypothetical protein